MRRRAHWRERFGGGLAVPAVALAAAALAIVAASACGLDTMPLGPPGGAEGGTGDAPSSADGGTLDAPDGLDAATGPDQEAGTDAGLYGTRVTTGLSALYEFEDGTGATVRDSIAPFVPLTIEQPDKVAWEPHALRLTQFTTLSTEPTLLTKVANACAANNAATLEAWITSAQTGEDEYSRVASMGTSNVSFSFAMGAKDSTSYWVSLDPGDDFVPPAPPTSPALSHFVVTIGADRIARVYVDGRLVQTETSVDPVSDWEAAPLFVGNSASRNKGWLGKLHLFAIYCVALDDAAVLQNFGAGADP